MNIAFLTADEPLYLPALFAQLLAERAADTRGVFIVAPRYGRDSTLTMVRKYTRAFGVANLLQLVRRMGWAKLAGRLGWGAASGRYYSVLAACRAYGVPCDQIESVNDPAFHARLRALGVDLVVSVSCPQIFKRPLIDLPAHGCLNVHGALLPQYRGIAPSFWMMVNGETQAGVTVFLMNEDIDAGDVLEVERFPILPDETLDQFIVRSKRIHGQVLLRAIAKVESGRPATIPLQKEHGSYFSFPTREAYARLRARGRRLW